MRMSLRGQCRAHSSAHNPNTRLFVFLAAPTHSRRESYAEEIVHEVQSNTVEDMEGNVERVKQWVAAWKQNNP